MKKHIAPKTRSFLIALGAFLLLAALLALGGVIGGGRALTTEVVSSAGERAAFLRDCGWTVELSSETRQDIRIPEHFTAVYERYNELQRQQGYDLEPYAGQDCTLYTYTVTNYPDPSQVVQADLYVCRDRVIGGDVHSTSLGGFMIGLK